MPVRGDRRITAQRIEEILAIGPECILHWHGNALAQAAKRLGMSRAGIIHNIRNEPELIRQLCLRHLNEAFEAVCLPADWQGTPLGVLRAMSLALLGFFDENPQRHLVFLLFRQTLGDAACHANDALLTYLTHNFQLALQAVHHEKPFDDLQHPARMLLGQIMHLPLWWPAEPALTQDEWLCHQIGLLAGVAPPDGRVPETAHRQDAVFTPAQRGDHHAGNLPSQASAY
jgi:AcrR family transcriptional regulator